MPTSRLSINHYSIRQWDLFQLVKGCRNAGITSIGLWRDKVNEVGLETARQLVHEANITVSSLCRGGFFPYSSEQERTQTLADNQRAVDEAAALRAPLLVLVCGGIAAAGLEHASRKRRRHSVVGRVSVVDEVGKKERVAARRQLRARIDVVDFQHALVGNGPVQAGAPDADPRICASAQVIGFGGIVQGAARGQSGRGSKRGWRQARRRA